MSNKLVEVMFNQDFFKITTMSKGMLRYADPDVPRYYLEAAVHNTELGTTIRLALESSKIVGLVEFQKIWKSGIIQQKVNEGNALIMQRYGYKTIRELYKNMNCCWITVQEDGQIEIAPAHHDSIDGYSSNKTAGPFPFYVPETISDEELGAALREGFTKCTSSYK